MAELKGIFSVSPDSVSLILFSINSLLLANLSKSLEEARKPISLHSGVTKDILLCGLNCVLGFCNLYLNKRALITPPGSFKVNDKDFFTRDNSQDFPSVITTSLRT